MQGKLIVIEGTDGSGKGTQIRLLTEKLQKEDVAFVMVDFPQYGNPSAIFVEKYLRGEYGTAAEVGPYVASYFFALDRFDKSFEMRKILSEGTHIIANRYTTSNMGHQTGKLATREEQDAFLEWLAKLEYDSFKIPRPDVVVLLDVSPEVNQRLVDAKGHRDYVGGEKRDIHEADLEHLQKARDAYNYIAEKYGWRKINCAPKGDLLSMEDIHEKVWEEVRGILK